MVGIIDTVPAGEDYILVFEWATFVGQESLGEFPKKSARVAKSEFGVAPDSEMSYELVLHTDVDLSAIQFEDCMPTIEEYKQHPENFFHRRPENMG